MIIILTPVLLFVLLDQVAESSIKHGLWTNTVRWTMEDNGDSEDILMMETS